MRIARPLVPVLIALLALAGPALGAERSGGLSDAAGDVTSADGFARPDVAEFRVATDPSTGSLITSVRFHQPVPRTQSGRSTAFKVVYNVGRAAPQGYCDWTHTGDLGVRIDVVRAPDGDYILQTATPRGGADVVDNAAGSFSADSTTLTVVTARSQFAGRDFTCVSPTRVTYEPLTGADEVAEFFFAGFTPPPPPPDDQPPSIRWETPSTGATISGVYSEGGQNGSRVCRMSASDNVRVNRIEIFVDGVPTEIQRFAPWGCEIDTRKLSEGSHLLRADAYDEAGNRTSTTIPVTVRNSGVAPPPAPPPVVIPPDTTPVPVTPPVVLPPPVVVTAPPTAGVPTPPRVTPNVVSRLEPFMRCRVVGRTVRGCRFKPSAFLSVRVTDQNGALRMDRSGAVRLAVSCRPKARCDRRVLRLRTARMTLASLLGGPAIRVGTTVEIRLTRRGSVGRHHRLKITRNGPRSRTCELVGSRLRSCE